MSEKTEVKNKKLKDIFSKDLFKGEVKFMEPMKNHTSLRIGGPADVFVVPQDLPSLMNIKKNLKNRRIPFFPIGGGTNILVKDGGIEGMVISSKFFRRIEIFSKNEAYVNLNVESGTPLQRLVNFSKEQGYSGVEGLTGIPGTVGGAICGNAGAFGYEIKDVLIAVEIIGDKGKTEKVKAEKIDFGYRNSSISSEQLISSAEIRLRRDTRERVSAKTDDFLKIKRERQPLWEPSAGCVFKNPPGTSAGKLIEEAGCKGMRTGDVEVSNIHTNFFINIGNAKASDFITLMETVAQKVEEISGIVLVPEIKIVGRDEVQN
ncbi:MAG: UDP-N-acetylmuramate dehydrogenase [Nitrospirae bacterium]|jgi:UDP-N-acetylmuramate dehydrogenase|nr:UDP-N-acetylmuramate dehydrogenase [Nitrospirota bacterium]